MFLKDSTATLDYKVDWSAACTANISILASKWAVEPVESEGIFTQKDQFDNHVASVQIGGGVVGHVYRVANVVTFSDGRTDLRSLAIRVENR
jgi:hypothetical protein